MEQISKVNFEQSAGDDVRQLTLDMEDELKKLSPIKFEKDPNDGFKKTGDYDMLYDNILTIY